jgi:glycosyltransferase involved in cell wall biosynthesis
MRIVFVGWQGSEHTRRWAGFFAARGHDVHVLTCGDRRVNREEPPSYAVHDVGRPLFGKVGYLLKAPRVRRLVRSLAPDVVHAHHATSYGLLASLTGVHPLIVTCHGSDVLISGRKPLMRPFLKYVFAMADVVTAPGDHVRDAIRALRNDRDVVVFQYGVDVNRLRAIAASPQRHTPARGPIRLVSARPLEALYHTDNILRAAATLRDRGVECVCDVAGTGREMERLRRLTRVLGIVDRVTFHGHIPEEATAQLIATADVYVSISESDGVSIALLEAMALGPLPVLSDIEANRLWVRDGVNGCLVGSHPSEVADGIMRALDLDRAEVQRRNLEIVSARGDRDANLAACEDLLLELVAACRRRRRQPLRT